MSNSTHRVEVVPVVLEPHPKADSLSIVRVFAGYTVCVRTDDWRERPTGAYVPPDSIVDSARPEFSFLKTEGRDRERIKVKRLRGVVSMGLLAPTPDGAQIGDDVAETLGVTHYEPVQQLAAGDQCDAPKGYYPVFDVESMRRYADAFEVGERVWVTEKIHGANGRWCFVDGEMHAGSRTTWKKRDAGVIWWKAMETHPEIEEWCRANPNWTLYGEVYGQVQDLRYGIERGVRVALFDRLSPNGIWLGPTHARNLDGAAALPWVPIIAEAVPFDLEAMLALAEGKSLVPGANHVREGCVVKPMHERVHDVCGRVCLKIVGNGYLERA